MCDLDFSRHGQMRLFNRRRSTSLSGRIKRSFSLARHRTSGALEPEFWEVLMRMAEARGQGLSALVAAVDAAREPDRPLASALRVTALLAQRAE
jgi:predicted DNA-binding ribbon-helix-helix protein